MRNLFDVFARIFQEKDLIRGGKYVLNLQPIEQETTRAVEQ